MSNIARLVLRTALLVGVSFSYQAIALVVPSKTNNVVTHLQEPAMFRPLDSSQPNNVPKLGRRAFLGATGSLILADPLPAKSLSPEEAARDYDTYSTNYDDLDGGQASNVLGIEEARSSLFRQARGAVLEIGAGTGLNLNKYDPTKVTSLTLVDISDGMLQEAKKRASSMSSLNGIPVEFVKTDATSQLVERFGKESFDTVVDSFSLCVMGNEGARKCLDQLRQVVKTNENAGLVLLLENSRSSNPLLGIYQDATADAAASAGGKGCVYNQDVAAMIRSTRGMSIENEELYAAGLFRSYRCVIH
jgi:methyltransferase OMS1